MDRLSKDIEVLRRRALERKAKARGKETRKERPEAFVVVDMAGADRTLEHWLKREQRALEVAADKRNERAASDSAGWVGNCPA